jgi:hypothetical protein
MVCPKKTKQKTNKQTIQKTKEKGQRINNTMTKRKRTKGQTIQ